MSGFEYLGMTLTAAETKLIENLLCMFGGVLNHSITKEILLLRKQCAFENDSNNLLTTGVFG